MRRILYRDATLDDYEEFIKMHGNAMFSGMPRTNRSTPFSKEKYIENLGGNIILAVDENQKFMGYAILIGYDDGSCRIVEMYVKIKRQGYGRDFFDYLYKLIKKEGFVRIELHSVSLETDRFWEKMGFSSINYSDEYEMKIS